MTHEYAVRSGHPKTRTTSATPIRLHSLTKSMPQSKPKLHNVQEKTCRELHSVQSEGMKHSDIPDSVNQAFQVWLRANRWSSSLTLSERGKLGAATRKLNAMLRKHGLTFRQVAEVLA